MRVRDDRVPLGTRSREGTRSRGGTLSQGARHTVSVATYVKTDTRKITLLLLIIIASCFFLWPHQAFARSATFTSPSTLSEQELLALSTSGDNAALTVATSQSLQLLFDEPFGVTSSDSVSIFTLPVENRGAFAGGTIRIGVFENGVARTVFSRNFQSAQRVNVNNLFRRGCGSLGGCNFIEIVTRVTRGDAEGVRIDYIQINGEVVSVTAPTPEPEVWALMILGFGAIAWRAKTLRLQRDPRRAKQRRLRPPNPSLAPGLVRLLPQTP